MSNQPSPVTVHILDKEYRIACKAGDEDTLFESSQLLDTKMREVRETRKVLGTDRVAVMAALNIASDLVKQQIELTQEKVMSRRIQAMHLKIDNVLNQLN